LIPDETWGASTTAAKKRLKILSEITPQVKTGGYRAQKPSKNEGKKRMEKDTNARDGRKKKLY